MTDIVQLPFTLFTEIAQTWTVQRDNVNTAIIHSYSTLRGEIEIEIIMVKVMKKRVTNIDVTTRGKIQIDIFMVATVTKLVMKIIVTPRGDQD